MYNEKLISKFIPDSYFNFLATSLSSMAGFRWSSLPSIETSSAHSLRTLDRLEGWFDGGRGSGGSTSGYAARRMDPGQRVARKK